MDGKKISFGFSKIAKKTQLVPLQQTKKTSNAVELIKCLEAQQIQLVEEKPAAAPLIIPLPQNEQTSGALASMLRRRAVILGEEVTVATENEIKIQNDTNVAANNSETLEARAVRELLAEVRADDDAAASAAATLVLPITKPDELPLDGAKQSTLDDYDAIPIQQFGLAMLRGMGWTEPPKKGATTPAEEMPFVRPKGMGLGADKALKKAKPLLVPAEANEVLQIKKQAFVRILAGKHKDMYGQIEGFDDHAGRVIVKMAIGGAKHAFNEFLCQPISRKEYAQYGKCINTAKYEEYKQLENEHGQIILKPEKAKQLKRSNSAIKNEQDYKQDLKKMKQESVEDNSSSEQRSDKSYKVEKSQKLTIKQEIAKMEQDQQQNCRNATKHTEDYNKRKRTYVDDAIVDQKSYKNYEQRAASRDSKERYKDSTDVKQRDVTDSRRHRDASDSRYRRDATKGEHHRDATVIKSRRDPTDDKRRDSTEKAHYSHKSRSTERQSQQKIVETFNNRKRHNHHQQPHTSSIEQSSDTSMSSSDSDSAYERKHKKKLKSKKKKAKKSKSKKNKQYASSTTSCSSSGEHNSAEECNRQRKQSKKKSKKSKKQRSRTRSRTRIGKR